MTKEELNEWKKLPETQWVMANIMAQRLVIQGEHESWYAIELPNFALVQARDIGVIEGLNAILNIDIEEPETNEYSDDDDEESAGT